jgi:hypothetical protein
VGLPADQVGSEFAENEGSVEDETIAALGTLRQRLARIGEIVAVFGGAGPTELNHLEGHVANTPNREVNPIGWTGIEETDLIN